jgi:hypothetical protein
VSLGGSDTAGIVRAFEQCRSRLPYVFTEDEAAGRQTREAGTG